MAQLCVQLSVTLDPLRLCFVPCKARLLPPAPLPVCHCKALELPSVIAARYPRCTLALALVPPTFGAARRKTSHASCGGDGSAARKG